MKKLILIPFIITFVLTIFVASTTKTMRKEGAEPGHTGSPGDGLKNCTACHGGTAQNVDNWISSNIPSTGYMPGEVYTITTTNNEIEGTRFGFQISPQNENGNLLGELIITDSVQTQLVGNKKYITYTENGVEGNGSKTWTFNWKAPDKGTGKVVFYGAYNSNFEGHKGSDHTFLSTLSALEHGTLSVNQMPKVYSSLSVYPKPANNQLNMTLTLKKLSHLFVEVTDTYGKNVFTVVNEMQNGLINKQINTSNLPSGIYFLKLSFDGNTYSEKFIINH